MKAIEQHFHLILFFMLHKEISNFKSCLDTNCEPKNGKHKTELGSGSKGHRVISFQKSKMFKYFPQIWKLIIGWPRQILCLSQYLLSQRQSKSKSYYCMWRLYRLHLLIYSFLKIPNTLIWLAESHTVLLHNDLSGGIGRAWKSVWTRDLDKNSNLLLWPMKVKDLI